MTDVFEIVDGFVKQAEKTVTEIRQIIANAQAEIPSRRDKHSSDRLKTQKRKIRHLKREVKIRDKSIRDWKERHRTRRAEIRAVLSKIGTTEDDLQAARDENAKLRLALTSFLESHDMLMASTSPLSTPVKEVIRGFFYSAPGQARDLLKLKE